MSKNWSEIKEGITNFIKKLSPTCSDVHTDVPLGEEKKLHKEDFITEYKKLNEAFEKIKNKKTDVKTDETSEIYRGKPF